MRVNNLLKVTGLGAVLFMSTTANAWEGNFLVGASAGWGSHSGELILNSVHVNNEEIDETGFVGGLFAGYQITCNPWVFGVEAAVDFQDFGEQRSYAVNNAINVPLGVTYEYEKGTAFSLSVRGGYKLTPWMMPYIRLGGETSEDEMTASVFGGPALRTSGVNDKQIYRFLGGVGVEFFVPNFSMLSFRAEYNYHSKGEALQVDSNPLPGTPATFMNVFRTKQDQHTGRAAIVLNFG